MKPYLWPVRVRYVDTDASQRIHYTALFRFFEYAECEFLRELGHFYNDDEARWPRVHVECDISGAMVFDDHVMIEVRVGRVGNTSYGLEFRAINKGVECGTGRVVIVCMDPATQRAKPLPSAFADALRGLL